MRESEILRQALAGDDEAWRRLGAEYDAEILVTGEAFSEFVGNFRGLISCRARVEVRVIRVDTGEILTAYSVHESGVDISEAAAGKKGLDQGWEQCCRLSDRSNSITAGRDRRGIQVFVKNLIFPSCC